MTLTEQQIFDQLKKVIDPELKIDIVSLGLIYQVKIGNGPKPIIYIKMTLTTPGCPLVGVIQELIKETLSEIKGVDRDQIEIELTFDPPWMTDMMSDEAKAELGFD